MKKTKKLALYGLMIALALIMSYVESLIPAFYAVPGMKLGLTNIVVLFALYRMDSKAAVIVNLLRIVLVALLFGNGMSMIYSVSGGLLSLVVMILLKKTNRLRIQTVSICGGVAHNVGQILAAMVVMGTGAIASYLVMLWFAGVVSGALIGILGAILVDRVPDM